MAARSTYMYQITMGHGDKEEKVAYCYARNAGRAVDGMKQIYKEYKYDSFRAKLFGEVDIRVHPGPFEPMSREEVEYISNSQIASAPAYAMRKNAGPLPEGGEFIPVTEGEVV